MVIRDSVIPTVAMASDPRRETKKMSTSAKTDSMIISSTMGMLRSMMALLSGICVKSLSEPPIASRKSRKNWRNKDFGCFELRLICDIELRIIGLKRKQSDAPALEV